MKTSIIKVTDLKVNLKTTQFVTIVTLLTIFVIKKSLLLERVLEFMVLRQ